MNALARWMDGATPKQRNQLAKAAKTTVGTLRQIAGGYRKTNVTADLAGRIDRAVVKLFPMSDPVPRESLCPACKVCEFAKQCRS